VSHPPEPAIRRLLAVLIAALLLGATAGFSSADAAPRPAVAAARTKVFTADAQPTWQTNGTVWTRARYP
jgi:hypothetical protein